VGLVPSRKVALSWVSPKLYSISWFLSKIVAQPFALGYLVWTRTRNCWKVSFALQGITLNLFSPGILTLRVNGAPARWKQMRGVKTLSEGTKDAVTHSTRRANLAKRGSSQAFHQSITSSLDLLHSIDLLDPRDGICRHDFSSNLILFELSYTQFLQPIYHVHVTV